MQEPLDQYIDTVRVGVRRLPPEEGEQEITEIRQHLSALVQARSELGDTEEAAIASAVEQFGDASAVRQRLLATYWRRRLVAFQQSWIGAIICPLVYAVLVTTVFVNTLYPLSYWFAGEENHAQIGVIYAVSSLQCGIIGWMSGRLCGWRCFPIIALWSVFCHCVFIVPQFKPGISLSAWIQMVTFGIILTVLPLAAAFIGQRRARSVRHA